MYQFTTSRVNLGCGREAHWYELASWKVTPEDQCLSEINGKSPDLLTFSQNLVGLCFTDTLDRQQSLLGGKSDRFDRIQSGIL